MLNVASLLGKCRSKPQEISSHICQNEYHQTDHKKSNIGDDIGEKGTLVHCCWDCKEVQSVWKTLSSFLRKLKIELPYDPAILILGIPLKNMKILTVKDMHTQMFIAALFTIANLRK